MRTAPVIAVPATASSAREVRERYGVSLADMKKALALAARDPRYAGDFLLALAWVDADALAINVRGDRAQWNAATAESRVETLFGDREPAAPAVSP